MKNNWKPIDTAPGCKTILVCNKDRIEIRFSSEEVYDIFTHWQELPKTQIEIEEEEEL